MKKPINRWVLAIVGVIVLVFAGMVYAWTVMSAPIAAMYPEWSKADLSLTFTIAMFFFCIGGLIGGLLSKKMQPRILLLIAAALFLFGFYVTRRADALIWLYIGFGVLAGLGSGFAYNAIMSSIGKWFPDKQGLISGILLMGFGIGSFLIGKVYTAVTPSDGTDVWRMSILIFGLVAGVVLLISSFFVTRPSAEWQAPAPKKATAKKAEVYEEINTGTMLKRPSFWMFFLWAVFLSVAGLGVISQGAPLAMEVIQVTPETATAAQMSMIATIVGLISIFNGTSRVLFGLLFDKIGRFLTMLIGGIVFIAAMGLILLALSTHSQVLLVISYIATGLGFGCVTPTNSAFTSLFYGLKNYPTNFSIINMNLLFASFGSTLAGILFDKTGSYTTIIVISMALIVLGTILACLIRKPKAAREAAKKEA